MNKKSYTALILAAAMVAASPVAVFAQETDTQITSEAKAADDVSDQSLSEQPWLPVLPAAAQAQEFKMVSFADTEAVDQDGILSRTVTDEENGLYVITYGDEEHPVLDADKNEITDEYVDALVKHLKYSETELQKEEKDQNKQEVQETQEPQAALETAESVVETFEIDYVVNGEETPLEAPRYVVLKIDGLLESDPVTILHQGEVDGKAEWAPLEIVAQADGLVCARFDSFSPTVVLSTKEVALTASAAAANDQTTTAGNVTANQNTAQNTVNNTQNNSNQNTANNTQNTTNNVQDNAGTVTTSDHTHTLTFVPAVAATSTQHGNIAYYKCDGCEKMFSDQNGTTEITNVIEHNWGQWTITKNATANEAGAQERVCTICGEKETKEIPAGTNMSTYNPNAATGQTAAWNASNNTAASSADGKIATPKTGDSAGMPAVYVVLIAAVAALVGLNVTRRRQSSNMSGNRS
ncbi:MAG: hypothetical protein IJV59_03990 [Eubacterium sp.]|nr:hypothetical protein [Eubacterium sp.]